MRRRAVSNSRTMTHAAHPKPRVSVGYDEPPIENPKPHRRITCHEMILRPSKKYLVEGILDCGELSMIYGPPKTGKTFLGLDIACSVATGARIGRRSVRRGAVLYYALENSDWRKRLLAWKQGPRAKSVQAGRLPLLEFVEERIDLADDEDVESVIATVKAFAREAGAVRLIVIDTLARAWVGDAKWSGPARQMLGGVDKIMRQTGATVLLIHHTTKDGETYGGHPIVEGWADGMISLTARKGLQELRVASRRDAEAGDRICFRLKTVRMELVNPDTGEIETQDSCRVVWQDREAQHNKKKQGASRQQTEERDLVVKVLRDHTDGLSRKELRRKVDEMRGSKSTYSYRLIDRSIKSGSVVERGGKCFVAR